MIGRLGCTIASTNRLSSSPSPAIPARISAENPLGMQPRIPSPTATPVTSQNSSASVNWKGSLPGGASSAPAPWRG